MLGRIGTQMLLWVPPWDSVMRPWGYGLHGFDWESYGGAHRVALEASSEMKAQAKAKFHMYYFILR
jgi:hypothetical protein